MKKEDIHLWDVHRILFGEAPAEFMIEVFARTIFIYLVLLVTIRLMGKRMSGQLTTSEMSVMVTLGAIVSPAMQIPIVGLLQGVFILLIAFAFQRGLNWLEFKNPRLEQLNHGKVVILVKDGTLVLDELSRAKLSRQQLFAALRAEGIYNLGEVERVYLEAIGTFSIYQRNKPLPGLSILPPKDKTIQSLEKNENEELSVCKSCGHLEESGDHADTCEVCHASDWHSATIKV